MMISKEITGIPVSRDVIEGMTRFPSFYEPFLRGKRYVEGKPIVDLSGVQFNVTEKMDGTAIGVGICPQDGWFFVRGRRAILAVSGDFNYQDLHNVVKEEWDKMAKFFSDYHFGSGESLVMFYGEWYGEKIQKRKYRSDGRRLRFFAKMTYMKEDIELFLNTPREKWQSIRKKFGQIPIEPITENVGDFECVPQLGVVDGAVLTSIDSTVEWLAQFRESRIQENSGEDVKAEGIVLLSNPLCDYVHPKEGKVGMIFKVKFGDFEAFRGTKK